MADVQLLLLSKAILHQDLRLVVNSRITPDFFNDDRYRQVFEYLLKHWSQYGTAPDEEVVKRAYPTFEPVDDPQPTEYFIDQLRERRKHALAVEGLDAASRLLIAKETPGTADAMLQAMHEAVVQARLETMAAMDEEASLTTNDYLLLIRERMDDPGYLRGISTGYMGIDLVTGGLQPEQFVVLIGTPKSFKSATLLSMALNVRAQAKVALFVGFEMSNTEQKDRMYSLLSGVGLTKIMRGNLSAKEERAIERAAHILEAGRPFFFSTDITSATTVSGIQAKVQEYDPDVIFVDGAYLMQSEIRGVEPGSPQAITSISRGLKRLAQSTKKPICVTTQASLARAKGGVLSLSSAMYSQAWGQDADIFLGVERQSIEGKEESDEKGSAIVKFRVLESRSGPRADTYLEWDWSKGSVKEVDGSVKEAIRNRSDQGDPGY